MKIVFVGSGDIGLPSLRLLLGDPRVEVCALVTQPDRAAGRGLREKPSAIKELALTHGLPVLQPARLRDPGPIAEVAALQPDLLVVMAYGQILSQALLDVPPLGCLNLHASLLPRHRGAAPIHAAILAGDAVSGVTVMWMAAGLDTGDMLLAEQCGISADETAGSLHDKLAELAPVALRAALAQIREGRAPRVSQDETQATYAAKLDRESGRIDWRESAEQVARKIRALHPWPGSFTDCLFEGGQRSQIKVHRAAPREGTAPAGELHGTGFLVGCGAGGLVEVIEVQAPGGRRMSADEFLRGHRVTQVGQAAGG
jgi:methionyl-tRNA formyltransferase